MMVAWKGVILVELVVKTIVFVNRVDVRYASKRAFRMIPRFVAWASSAMELPLTEMGKSENGECLG